MIAGDDTALRRGRRNDRPPESPGEARRLADAKRRLQLDFEGDVIGGWERFAPFYGPLYASWRLNVGRRPAEKLALLCDTVLAGACERRFPSAFVELDRRPDGEVVGLILDDGVAADVIPLALTANSVKVGGNSPVSFGSRTAGERVVAHLISAAADYFARIGEPRRLH